MLATAFFFFAVLVLLTADFFLRSAFFLAGARFLAAARRERTRLVFFFAAIGAKSTTLQMRRNHQLVADPLQGVRFVTFYSVLTSMLWSTLMV